MIGMYKSLKAKIFLALFLVLFIPFSLVSAPDEIELRDTENYMDFTYRGKIIKKYRRAFTEATGVDGEIQTWADFKQALDSSQKKGAAGEVAAKFFFKDIGYKVLEEHYLEHLARLKANAANTNAKFPSAGMFTSKTCTTKKGPDNGIDGIFFLKEESLEDHSHVVINESKFRDKSSLNAKRDFGFVQGEIQQSHSKWNRERFSWPTCFPGRNYDNENVIRTATLLDQDGTLRLYEIRDKDTRGIIGGEFASAAPKRWNIRKIYDKNIGSKFE